MAKQYNLKDINGLHLKSPYDYNSYNSNGVNALIENFDFYPLKTSDISGFIFINGSYRNVSETSEYHNKIMGNAFIGDNSYTNRTHDLTYTQIKKTKELVKGEKYYIKFDFYFNFDGDAYGFDLGSTGYTINTELYAVLGNTKRKLKLSNPLMYDFDNPTYSNTTDNPLDEGYTTISADIYSDNISINGDNISMSYMPRPKEYDITGGVSSSSLSFTQGDSNNSYYGSQITIPLTSLQSYRVISFDVPQLGPSPNTWVITDQGYSPTEQSPFNVMNGGYLFKVTAELDTTSMAEFDANICKGNKDFKIIVDYNGTFSQTIITYEDILYEVVGSLPNIPGGFQPA